ncbi:MAG: TolC family protein [Flavobacteriaceae bacterium]|nr:TolC family protein [Flavobacteriaceae bacterium]
MIKLKTLLVFTFLIAISAQAQTAWTLKDCVNYAIENNISIKEVALDTLISIENIRSAKGNFLPTVNATGSQNYNFGSSIGQKGIRISRDIRGNDFGLNVGLNLFNGFQNSNLKKQAFTGLESNKLQLDILKNDIMVMVANNYLTILFNKENLKIAEQQKEITEKQIEQLKELVQSGVKAKSELLNSEAQLASDKEGIVNAQNNLDIAVLNMAQLLQISHKGLEFDDVSVELPSVELMYNDSDEIFGKAVVDRPEIKRAELLIENSDYNIKIAKGAYYPSLRIGAGLGTAYEHTQGKEDQRPIKDPIPGDPNNIVWIPNGFDKQLSDNMGYYMGLNLNVPIFNGNRTKASVNKAKVNSLKAEYRLEKEKQDLRANIETAYTDAKAALNQYLASEASVEAQKLAFENAQNSYDLGVMNSFDFEQVRSRYVNAQTTLVRSKYNFVFKSKLLEFYFGIPIVAE